MNSFIYILYIYISGPKAELVVGRNPPDVTGGVSFVN